MIVDEVNITIEAGAGGMAASASGGKNIFPGEGLMAEMGAVEAMFF